MAVLITLLLLLHAACVSTRRQSFPLVLLPCAGKKGGEKGTEGSDRRAGAEGTHKGKAGAISSIHKKTKRGISKLDTFEPKCFILGGESERRGTEGSREGAGGRGKDPPGKGGRGDKLLSLIT